MKEKELEKLRDLSRDYSYHIGDSNKDYLVIKSQTINVKISKQTIIDHRASMLPIMVKEYAEVKHYDAKFNDNKKLRHILKKEYKFLVFFAENGDLHINSEAQEIKIDYGYWINLFKEEV